MSVRSMTEVAYEIMKQQTKEIPFSQLWTEVSKELAFNENQAANKIASFYSSLMLDNRFISLADNCWDLKARRTYNETHIDISSIEIDDDSDSEELEDDELSDDISELVNKED